VNLDIQSLWDFYYTHHLGAVAQRNLQRAMRQIWPDVKGRNLVGYGFAAPFLRPFRQEAARTLCLMPEMQGAGAWPRDGASATALVHSGSWPLPNGFVDRLIVAHAVETEPHLDHWMEEVSRVLAPEGRVLIVVANRRGLWARSDNTPFGAGRPYSAGQLDRLLRDHDLTPETHSGALYFPPSDKRFWLRSAGAAERFGRRLDAQRFAGALMVEATKQVFALPRSGSKVRAGGLLDPIRGLAPKPVKPVGAANRD
jgi:SAM-dependent methyltransferase